MDPVRVQLLLDPAVDAGPGDAIGFTGTPAERQPVESVRGTLPLGGGRAVSDRRPCRERRQEKREQSFHAGWTVAPAESLTWWRHEPPARLLPPSPAMSEDRYGSFDYSRLIAWDDRLQREWPFLDEVLHNAPSRRLLDLGAGTGEHARFLAGKGFEVVGVDSSPAMLERSRATPAAGVTFVEGDMRDLAAVVEGKFGAAICLGNALPHLTGPHDLERLASGLRQILQPGAPFVLQILNYDRIEARRERALPLTFLRDPEDPQATIIFLRTMELLPDGRALFMPSTLRQRSDRELPLELLASRRVEIRAWRRAEVETVLRHSGFGAIDVWGSYAKDAFDPDESRDVILVAR